MRNASGHWSNTGTKSNKSKTALSKICTVDTGQTPRRGCRTNQQVQYSASAASRLRMLILTIFRQLLYDRRPRFSTAFPENTQVDLANEIISNW
jgi:hypothetical protein